MPNFSANIKSAAQVADRVEGYGLQFDRMSFIMDLLASDGENDNLKIDWPHFIAATQLDFMHDVQGIYNHLNRTTGHLDGCFVPRFAITL